MTFKTHRIIPILLAVVFVCVTSCERTIIKVEETETVKMTEVSETENTATEGATVVPETDEMTEEPETTAFDDQYDMTAEELYRAIRNDEIPYDDAVKYPAFRAEVEQKFSEVLGHPIAWEDLSVAIEDHDEMFHYSFWIRDSEEYITFLQCVVLSWMDSDDSILYSLYWSELYPVYGFYTYGDGIIGRNGIHYFNKTMLEALLIQNFDMSVHTAIYEGIRYADHHILVPMMHDGMIVCADILVDADLQYQLYATETIDLMALSPYEFLVTHQTFGLTPQELMEYFPNHPLNPRYAVSGYMGIDDILQSDYYMTSWFGTQPYIRVQDSLTDVIFGLSLPQTPEGEALDTADITEDTTYQDLAWVVWIDRET